MQSNQDIEMMAVKIIEVTVEDIRFPTSDELVGSDAMHTNPDYSCAYVTLRTNVPNLVGVGTTFTLGKGTDVVVECAKALNEQFIGKSVVGIVKDYPNFYRSITSEPQLRWVGPEKGVLHLATAALLNAFWDLYAKIQRKPLWKVFVDMTPEELVGLLDFRYLSDVITKEEAITMLKKLEPTKQTREKEMLELGYPSYTTSAGWMGYSDEKITRLCKGAIEEGFSHIKIKVGADIEDDIRRCRLIRSILGPDRKLMVDANQRWDVNQAIDYMKRLAEFNPWWIEEPTSPDDILGHAAIAKAIAPLKVATGEQCQNRIIFKQLLQSNAISFCQPDSCRLAGPTEVITVMILCAKFGVPVCMHAGGVGLCEYVNHLCIIDYIIVSGSLENRISEYVPHLNEHYIHPSIMKKTRYQCPSHSGYGGGLKEQTIKDHRYPNGPVWLSKNKPPVHEKNA
ncbi:mandelate racemase/muconate lactonizing protein [Cavenderia fasciculata]|uniref:Mandelate racemase/muconate lactonizing protein n=1 Tax=Cavenderia fasciculata TaxID=261658 RepID=F4Q956_CACFS|nr:mandelate racemase/muconate lactonizing protein [Cavenderia fasciculata]EGG15225.1 mandelate racemase/muconate lactonizing protein [Cavenderia fasciculata]|eukprot:XP_004351945.1 mandelate racemase/muconate lactonizing protein [Cavenderia fasciculata]